jgi:biopolymer transport protein ExbB
MSVCLVGVVLLVGQVAFAQPAPAAGAAAKPPSQGLISIVLDNMDPVFWTIAILSVLGMTLIIQGFIKARASVMIPETSTNHMRELIGQKQFKELIEYTETDPSFVSKALNPALKRAPSFAAMKEAMETAIGEQTADQFRKIEFLNIIGNLGPLLGLLGTVIGMIHSFQKMKESGGQADPSVLAGGISQALTHTMLGLVLALPCLAAFGVLRTMVDRLTVQGALISEELLLMVKPADAKPGTGAAAPGAARPATGAPPAAAIPAARKPMPAPPAAAV